MLKLQYFGLLIHRANSLEKTLMLGKVEGRRRRGEQRMRWFGSITDSMHMNLSKLPEIGKDREAWHAAIHRVTKSQTQLSYWKTTTIPYMFKNSYKSIVKKLNNPIQKVDRGYGYTFSKEDIQMAKTDMKRCSTSLTLEKCISKLQWDIT